MSNAALKARCVPSTQEVLFSANLEDGSSFSATLTELRSSSTPGRGDIWVVIAADRSNNSAKTFTITFSKDIQKDIQSEIGQITDEDDNVSLFYNNYEDPTNPTLQKARSGTIQYELDLKNMTLTGSFNADIDKADGSGHYLCRGHFDTALSRSGPTLV
ncbi:hypothetical protein HV782_014335 [Pseudomonas monsensis]|uniref:hypothetical protein n=1 Tax=Pseudomonas monsensis TaxID=2745509 RepID=UPI00164490DB|nr:hypothetical protein [Pseudomonas monsensis]MDZ3826400.1 hypothetical protein [Pseudomonas monsensis]QXH97769.1 hypothetical protein HV782_014335 [Pseudomonas monsensis]